VKRRDLLKLLFFIPASLRAAGSFNFLKPKKDLSVIKQLVPIDFQWPTQEPFLFCVHHHDFYPVGNQNRGVESKHFAGRSMGSDFVAKDGFRLYHGSEIPGFPVHPHRGFETITIVRKGYVDHADSLGAAGRYGEGDVQWMTAGAGVQHSEMFPLLHQDRPNTLELFQIWLNLPKKNKMVPADFKMLWAHQLPRINSHGVEVTLISGEFAGKKNLSAPKNSWASDEANEVNIFLVKMKAGTEFHYPASKSGTNRTLYFFEGKALTIQGTKVSEKHAALLDSSQKISLQAETDTEFLWLEAKPIGEPVVQHGPFVMNTREEIFQAIRDYQRTEFGGWKWPRSDMMHGSKIERFAKYPDGKIEKPS
jgi:quercetin 2,3-dioxygenase